MLYKPVSKLYFPSAFNCNFFLLRAEYTKEIVKPVLGERGVGGAMAVYGVFDAIVSGILEMTLLLLAVD